MNISIGSDHAGFELKEFLKRHLLLSGHEVTDRGTMSTDSTDYPDQAHAVAEDVSNGSSGLGVVICGSANGVNITANKHHGVRSAIAWRPDVAALARQHNNANVLALPARFVDNGEAVMILDAFLAAEFEGGRHERRVKKIEGELHEAH
jgi:ribose 5-phosphate isomerase B